MLSEQQTHTLEQLSAAAAQTEDDIRYYSGGLKHNEPLEQLKDRLVELYRTGQLVAVQPDELKGDAVIEAVQTLLEKGKVTLDGEGYLVAYPFVQPDDVTVERVARAMLDVVFSDGDTFRDMISAWFEDELKEGAIPLTLAAIAAMKGPKP